MRRDDPPSPRLTALLLAVLAGFALLFGGGTGALAAPFAVEVAAEESVGHAAIADRRVSRSVRRVLTGRVLRARRPVLRDLRRGGGELVRSLLSARSIPLRGPPLLATA